MTRVDGAQGHHAGQAAQDAHSAGERAAHAHSGQVQASHVSMQHTQLRAKIQHKKAQVAAFYRSKRFATSHHTPASSTGQKLMRQLGQRPRPAPSAKERGKNVPERERHEPHQSGSPEKEHDHKHEGQHEQKHQQKQEQGRGQHEQGQQQPRDSLNRERRGKPAAFALTVGKVTPPVPPSGLQAIAEQRRDSPDLPRAVAVAYTQAVLKLSSHLEFGPLLAPLLVLTSTSPAVLNREPARLHAQRNGAFAQRPAVGGKPAATAATAELIGHSLDLTLARQRFQILYKEDEQSLAAIRQRLLDAVESLPAAAAQSAPGDSRKPHEVRIAPAPSGTKP